MGKKVNIEYLFIFFLFTLTTLVFYYPVLLGKIPLNGNLLVSFFPPWMFERWQEFPTGVPFRFLAVDEVREFYPLFDFTYQSVRSGFIPLWNPYNFSGYPHLANWASAVFYPLHVAFFFASKIYSFIFLKLSAIVLSGFFTYLYLRSISLDKKSAFFGGSAFAFSSTMLIWGAEIWQSVHVVLWLPLILFGIERYITLHRIKYLLLTSVGFAMSIMAGYVQPTIYVFVLSAFYAIFRSLTLGKFNAKFLFFTIFATILGVGLSAIHTFPGIEAYFLSPRREISLLETNLKFLLPWYQSITLLAPDFFGHSARQNWFLIRPGQYYENIVYVGLLPLLLAPLSFYAKKHRFHVLFFMVFSLLSLILVFNNFASRLVYLFNVPFLSSAIAIRIILIFAFSVSVLGAVGMSVWFTIKPGQWKKVLLSLVPFYFIFLGVAAFLFFAHRFDLQFSNLFNNRTWYIVSARNSVIPLSVLLVSTIILIFGSLLKQEIRKLFYFAVLLIFLSHSFFFAQRYLVFTDRQFFYPQHPLIDFLAKNQGFSRYWGAGRASLLNNVSTVYGLYSPEGYDPVNLARYNELLSSSMTGEPSGIFSRSDALLYPVTGFPFKDENDVRYRLLDLLGVKYVGLESGEFKKAEQDLLGSDRFDLVWEEGNFVILENKKAFPRAFLVPQAISMDLKQEALKKIYDQELDLRKKVILEEGIVLNSSKLQPQGSVQITYYSPNKVKIRASTNTPQFLVLTDNFYPGWEALINGKKTRVYRADYTFRAVLLQAKGTYDIEFRFRPKSFLIGGLVSMVSFALILLLVLAPQRKKYIQ